MATITRKPTVKKSNRPTPGGPITRPAPESEAPDRGESALRREAPDSRPRGRSPEAPDAGEGRATYLEHEFTHGRSQS